MSETPERAREFDYVVVGGGTAGNVVAARLSEDPGVTVCLLEAGPSDVGDDDVLRLDRWMGLLESGYDWDYPVEPQEYGNSFMRHARARVLGGCSSHNSCIAFWAPAEDLDAWAARGCDGWSAADVFPLYRRLETNDAPGDHHGRTGPVKHPHHRAGRPVRCRAAGGVRRGRHPHHRVQHRAPPWCAAPAGSRSTPTRTTSGSPPRWPTSTR